MKILDNMTNNNLDLNEQSHVEWSTEGAVKKTLEPAGYINQFLTGWERYPQNIRTECVREIPIGHN